MALAGEHQRSADCLTFQNLARAITELGTSVNLLHQRGLHVPSMMMVYATIDVMAALARDAKAQDTTGRDFRTWVDRYMLPNSQLSCSADDLWGARCGLLHTYVPESRHWREGKARRLLYVAGVLDPKSRETIQLDVGEYTVVVSQDLFDALSLGLQRFVTELETDAALATRVATRADEFLVPLPTVPR